MTRASPIPSVVVIGAGQWGRNVVRALHDLDELAGIAETDPDRRTELAETYPETTLYEDHRAALKDEAPAVAIATPAPTHHPIAREAIQAGKDVYVEKPLTLTSGDAREIVRLADELDRVLMVGHLLLYQPAIKRLKDLIEEGRIGQVHSLHQQRAKLGRVRRVENVLWSFGVHDLAVFLHLLEEAPSNVEATGQRILQADIEDDVHVHLGFPSGVQAHLHTSWLWPETRRRLTVVGSDGMLVYDEVEGTITLHRATVDDNLVTQREGAEILFEDDGETRPLTAELDHFLNCVRERGQPRSPGRQGLAVVDILERADRAMEAER